MKKRDLTVYIALSVIIAILAVALYFFAQKPHRAPPPKLDEGPKAVIFKDVLYSGESKGNVNWEIKAKIARKFIDKPEVQMEVIEGEYKPKPGVVVLFKGSKGEMDTDQETGNMQDVDIVYKDEYRLKTKYMNFNFKVGFTHTDAPVQIEGTKLNMTGIGLSADTNAQVVTIEKDVKGFIEGSKGRYDFQSDKFRYLLKENVYVLENTVTMKGKDMDLFCDQLYLYSNENEMERVDALGHVKLLSKGTIAKSDKAVYHFKEDRVIMTGSPTVLKDRVNMAGESIVYDVSGGTFTVNKPKMRIDRR